MGNAAKQKVQLLSAGVPADGRTRASSARSNALGLSTGHQICLKAFGFSESLEIVRARLASKMDVSEVNSCNQRIPLGLLSVTTLSLWSGVPR